MLSTTHEIASISLVATSPGQAVRMLCEMAMERRRTRSHIHLLNAYSISLSRSNSQFHDVLTESAALNLPDGKPLGWLSRLRGDTSPLNQVRGPDLFEAVLCSGQEYGIRHFLLGATDETLQLLEAEIIRRWPRARIVGTFSPPFRAMTQEEIRRQDQLVDASGADIVWVGLGTPKQDLEARRLSRTVGALPVAVGAAFDFLAGQKPIAPPWMQRLGLEWLFRLASEPRRLWRRYLVGNAQFLALASSEIVAGRRSSAQVRR